MPRNDYEDPPYRIRNVATVLYGVGSALTFLTGLIETFAHDRTWGIGLIVAPAVVALVVKGIGQNEVNTATKSLSS